MTIATFQTVGHPMQAGITAAVSAFGPIYIVPVESGDNGWKAPAPSDDTERLTLQRVADGGKYGVYDEVDDLWWPVLCTVTSEHAVINGTKRLVDTEEQALTAMFELVLSGESSAAIWSDDDDVVGLLQCDDFPTFVGVLHDLCQNAPHVLRAVDSERLSLAIVRLIRADAAK